MLYKVLKFFLFKFDPETIHEFLLKILSFPGVPCFLKFLYGSDAWNSPVDYFGVRFKNRVGLAAGFDKNGVALKAWEALGFGFVEIGTVTPRPQSGNPKPRLFRFSAQHALVNAMGFNNEGIERVVQRIQKAKLELSIGLSIGKNKDTPLIDAWKDYVACIQVANDCVDFFVVNISSPNTPQLRELQKPKYLKELLEKILTHARRPLLLKLSPDLSDSEILDIMQICKPLSLSGFVASNTGLFKKAQILGARGGATEAYLSGTSKETRRGQRRRWAFFNSPNTSMDDMLLTGAPQGGISGAPLFEKSTDLLQKIRSQTDLPIIGVGGIDSIETAQRKITTGAQLIELYTGFIFEGPSLILRIKKAFKRIQSPLQKS